MEKQRDIAVVVHACDKFNLLFEGFFYFFDKYWDYSLDADYYFFSEDISVNHDRFKNIRTEKGEWTQRLRRGLKDIKSPYIIYLQEDMWFFKPVSSSFLTRSLHCMQEWDMVLLKLHTSGFYRSRKNITQIEGKSLVILDNNTSEYLLSHQISLWKRSFLNTVILRNEGPSENEIRGSGILKGTTDLIGQINYFEKFENAYLPNNSNRSFYFGVSQQGGFSITAKIFIDILLADIMMKNYGERLLHHYNEHLDHTGKKLELRKRITYRIKRRLETFIRDLKFHFIKI